ncbi:hypothetical protein [Anaerorhabdus sp.]|uniref:hypothetical protein n=1 Tax=Anaerorhabdus sp. TaxID=1872524 RepID=UPI002FC61D1E
MVLDKLGQGFLEVIASVKEYLVNNQGLMLIFMLVGLPILSIVAMFAIVFAIMYPISLLAALF